MVMLFFRIHCSLFAFQTPQPASGKLKNKKLFLYDIKILHLNEVLKLQFTESA